MILVNGKRWRKGSSLMDRQDDCTKRLATLRSCLPLLPRKESTMFGLWTITDVPMLTGAQAATTGRAQIAW